MRPAIYLLLLLSAACATTQAGVRQLPPKTTYQSAKSAAALEECFADNLSHFGGPSIIRGEGRTTLAFGSGGITSYMVEIAAPAVIVRSGYPYFGDVRRRIEACL